MKGLIFSEFLEYVEERFSPYIADDIIDACELPSGGVYTSVGTCHHSELVSLVTALSEKCGLPATKLLREFGKYLLPRLMGVFPHFSHSSKSTFELLQSVEEYIHLEVRKLYLDAELPTFEFESPQSDQLIVHYRSRRPFADFAHGMIEGSADYFDEDISIERKAEQSDPCNHTSFSLTKKG